MSRKRLAINLISNIMSFVITLLISFFLTPYIVKTLGASAYGFIPLANNFILYFSLIMVALNSMEARFITIEIKKENFTEANIYFSSAYYSNLFMIGLLIVPLALITVFINKILNVPPEILYSVRMLFSFLFANFLINLLTNRYAIATYAKNRLELNAIASIIINSIRASLTLILFIFFKPTIAYIGFIALVCGLVTFVMNYYFTKKLLPTLKINANFFSYKAVKELVSSGIWNTVNQLCSILMMGLSLLICNIFLGATATGPYAIAQSIPNIIVSMMSMLCTLFIPTIIYLFADNNYEGIVKEVKSANKLLGLLINIPVITLIVFGNSFYSLWLPNQNPSELNILNIIIIAPIIINGGSGVLSVIFPALNKLKVPSLVILFMGIVNISGTLILLKYTHMGIYAIPLVTSGLYVLYNFFFLPLYASKILKVKWNIFYMEIFKNLLSGFILFLVLIIIKKAFFVNSWGSLILVGVICTILGLFINSFIVFNLYELKQFIYFAKRKLKSMMKL